MGQGGLGRPVDGVGDLDFGYETLALPGDPDQTLVVYTCAPGSTTAERPALRASWTTEQAVRSR